MSTIENTIGASQSGSRPIDHWIALLSLCAAYLQGGSSRRPISAAQALRWITSALHRPFQSRSP